MAIEQEHALLMLQASSGRWIRPANNARLLAYLILAIKGLAEAAEDRKGSFSFRLAQPRTLSA